MSDVRTIKGQSIENNQSWLDWSLLLLQLNQCKYVKNDFILSFIFMYPGTDLGGFQGSEGTPWAPQGVPETPCGFGREAFLKCFYSQMRLPQHFYS